MPRVPLSPGQLHPPPQFTPAPVNPRKASFRLRTIAQHNRPDIRPSIGEFAICRTDGVVHSVYHILTLHLWRSRHGPPRMPPAVRATGLVLDLVGGVKGLDPGIARGATELRHSNVIDRQASRGWLEVELRDQGAFAVDDGFARHGATVYKVQIVTRLNANLDSVNLVIEVDSRRKIRPYDTVHFRNSWEFDVGDSSLLRICFNCAAEGEVIVANLAGGVGEEMDDVTMMARELFDRAEQRYGKLLTRGIRRYRDNRWRFD